MSEATVRALVRQRAGDCCEYCGLPQEAVPLATFHVEHIIAKQHGGSDAEDNRNINDPERIALRRALIGEGTFPPA